MASQTPAALVKAVEVRKHFDMRKSFLEKAIARRPSVLRAVDGVSLTIRRGETLGLVGESGCGKSTLGRTLLGLERATAGAISFDGVDLLSLDPARMRALRRRMQIIFQDPLASLNPRKTIGQTLDLPLILLGKHGRAERQERASALLTLVGLSPSHAGRYPHQLSGGQRQRVGIARALAIEPDFVVADEPVASLDVSIQAQIVNLLGDLQERFHLALLFISHDLRVVSCISRRTAVMYLGRIVEVCPSRELFRSPAHPYTQSLISAVPLIAEKNDRKRIILAGEPPDPTNPPSGCRFHPRCPAEIRPECREVEPELTEIASGHFGACHLIARR